MSSSLKGKVAIVTGGARGGGRAFALRLASLGADVAVFDINLRASEDFQHDKSKMTADTVMKEIEKLGVRSIGMTVDVGKNTQVFSAVNEVIAKLGRVDILVANAGGAGMSGYLSNAASDMNLEDMYATTERNYYGTVYSCMAVSKNMKERKSGKIVTIGSTAGVHPRQDGKYAHYGAAKAAVIMYTKYLAMDLAPYHINVNCMLPSMATGRVRELHKMAGTALNPSVLGKILEPEDNAWVVVDYLCTDLSDQVTGQVISMTDM